MARKKIHKFKSINAFVYRKGVEYKVFFDKETVLTTKDEGRSKVINKIKGGMTKLLDGTMRGITVNGSDNSVHNIVCYNLPPIFKPSTPRIFDDAEDDYDDEEDD
jgi:hypothetical protein